MRAKLVRTILLALDKADGLPMPESGLIAAARMNARPEEATRADAEDALKDAEGRGYVCGVSDDLTGRSWTLTELGKHKVRMLK